MKSPADEEPSRSAGNPIARVLERAGLPHGTVPVAVGLVVAGVCAYGFLVVSGRALGPVRYSQLSVLWSATFLLGAGLFLPLEQEIARVISTRRTRGLGGREVVIKGARIAVLMLGLLALVTFGWQGQIVTRFFDGETAFLLALGLALLGLGLGYVARGFLSGTRQFRRYGELNALEGLLRLVPAVLLALIGVSLGLPYALAFAAAPLLAAVRAAAGPFHRLEAGPPCGAGELDLSMVKLIAASVLGQTLINLPVLTVKFLATEAQAALAGRFMAGVVMARVPVVLFAAVQAALVPKLSALEALSQRGEFRRVLGKLALAIGVIGLAATLGAWTVGAPLVRFFFGNSFRLMPADLAYLAAASAFYLLALALAQGLVALAAYARLVAGWSVGLVTGVLVTALGGPLLLRVERGFLAGSLGACIAMGLIVLRPLRLPGAGYQPALTPVAKAPVNPGS
jgi:O-antigen/teichoic acid export membrane protein